MEAVTENSWKLIVEALSQSTFGVVVLGIVAVVVTTSPFWKWLYSIYKEKKEKYNEKKEQERKDAETMKQNISDIAKHLPVLDQQVLSLSTEVASFKNYKDEWVKTSKSIQSSIDKIQNDLNDLSTKSDEEDRKVSETLKETVESFNELKDTTKKIESDIGILFEGDNNEFRIFLTQLHAKHIDGGEPMTREIRQQLRIKFDSYEKRGGNGWAKELYLELMALPIESYKLPHDIS